MERIDGLIFGLIFCFFYLLPYLAARHRGHPNKSAIWIFNMFLGWTVIGWIIALIWAHTGEDKSAKPA